MLNCRLLHIDRQLTEGRISVPFGPAFNDLAAREPTVRSPRHTAWGSSTAVAVVESCVWVMPARGPMQHDQLALRLEILHADVQRREGALVEDDTDLDGLGPLHQVGDEPAVIDVLGGEQLVSGVEPASIP